MSLRGAKRRHLHRTAFGAVQVSNLILNGGISLVRYTWSTRDCFATYARNDVKLGGRLAHYD